MTTEYTSICPSCEHDDDTTLILVSMQGGWLYVKCPDCGHTWRYKGCPDCGEPGEGRGHYGCQYPGAAGGMR